MLEAGCGFVNCIPVFIAREDYWDKRFKKAGLPIVGDDIKSQVGATIVHRQLARLFGDRGVKMMRTSQLNVGGNMDFYNMLERERLESKKISKTNAVTSIMGHELPEDDVYIGPSDYVPWLTDRKWAHIRVEGQAFGDVPLNVEMKLEVWDSPNSAGIVIDAVRCCKLALNNGIGGQLDGPSSYLMKSPARQVPDDEAREDDRGVHRRSTRAQAPARGAKAAEAPSGQGEGHGSTAASDAGVSGAHGYACAACPMLLIAQVTPYPWEDHHEVNRYVERLARRAGARAATAWLVVAPSRLARRWSASRARAIAPPATTRCSRRGRARAARRRRACCPSARAAARVSVPVDVSRTIEELLDGAAARLRPRPRAVRAERGVAPRCATRAR